MPEAVVLANGLIIKKSFFKGELFTTFKDNGTVKDFFYNNVFYKALYSTLTEKFKFYGDQSKWLELQIKGKNNNRPTVSVSQMTPHSFSQALFEKDKAEKNDLVTLSIRYIKEDANGDKLVCNKVHQWPFNGQIFLNTNLITPPSGSEKSDACDVIDTVYSTFFNIHSKPKDKVIDEEVIADVAQILSDFKKNDSSFYKLLSKQGFLPLLEKQWKFLGIPTQTQVSDYYNYIEEYSTYDNGRFIKYRDFLLRYRAYYNVNKDYIGRYSEPEKMLYLSRIFNSAELTLLTINQKIVMVDRIAKGDLSGDWLFNNASEPIVIKLINSIAYRDDTGALNYREIDRFMDKLQARFDVTSESLFETLYDKIDDPSLFGDNVKGNRRQFIFAVYKLWLVSKYNPYKDENEDRICFDINYLYDSVSAPVILQYTSNLVLGFNVSGYTFEFNLDTNSNYKKLIRAEERISGSPVLHVEKVVLRGTYHMFQPVSLMEQVNETEVKMPYISGFAGNIRSNNFIPIFFLKYKNDFDWISNVKQAVNISLDVISFISVIGNVGKLRYLKYYRILKWGATEFKIFVGGIEFTSELLNLIVNHVIQNCTTPFCEKLKKFAFWMEVAVGSLDAITEQMIKKSARELKIVEQAGDFDFLKAERDDFKRKIDLLADTSGPIGDFYKRLINKGNLSELLKKFDGLSPLSKQEEFLDDFGQAADDVLEALNMNEGKLIDCWKEVKFKKVERKGIDFLESLIKIKSSTKLNKHIFEGDLKPRAGIPASAVTRRKTFAENGRPDLINYEASGIHSLRDPIPNDVMFVDVIIGNILGYYQARVRVKPGNGWINPFNQDVATKEWSKMKETTCFPDSWEKELIQEELALAFKNKTVNDGKLLSTGNYELTGVASDGTDLKMTIEPDGTILSAYPDIW